MTGRLLHAARLVGLAVALGLGAAGCENSTGSDHASGADPNAPFSITDPQSNETVDSGVIALHGVGLRDLDHVTVRVHTDKWYTQVGSMRQSDDHSWTYQPVYLGGQGRYNHHRIRVVVVHTDGTVDTAEVENIVRR